ncbi:MAG: nucleotidyltransferase domain-containing protein [Bacteroidetes bacterium]|nr:MAG: nucleotidyltransferase domain-containing protein [Bacteroidota bacterium]
MAESKDTIKSKLIEYSKLVRKEFDVYKILLYGSYAKGLQKSDSDIDVAVLLNLNDKRKKIEISKRLFLLARKIDIRIEPKCVFESELENLEPVSILSDILRNSEEIIIN